MALTAALAAWPLFCLAAAITSPDDEANKLRDELTAYQSRLLADFDAASSYELLRETLGREIKPTKHRIDLADEADRFGTKLQASIDKKIQALRSVVSVAEKTASSFSATPEPFDTPPEYVDVKNKTVLLKASNIDAKKTTSGVHIPVEVFKHEVRVERDISWLSTVDVTEAFRTNVLRDKSLFRQYVAAETGITAVYPAREWNQKPREYTVDLYDPRYRPWYVSTVSAPKDVLFVLDFSGSIAGQTARLMKLTVMSVLALLTADDYINAVWFNNEVGKILPCVTGHNFIPATTRNKVLLMRKLETTEPENVANLVQALNFTFDQFESDTGKMFARSNHRSGGHRAVMLLTDWIESWADSEIKRQVLNHGSGNETKVRFFGFAMGYDAVHIDLLQWLACENKGYYSMINSISDVRHFSRVFVPVLSRPMALALRDVPLDRRPVTWSGPYMDAQGQGAVITLSMPILNTMTNGSRQSLLGVAAIDIKVEHIREQFMQQYTGFDAYPMGVDNNGHVVLHPRAYLPVPDIQLVRRTACFPLHSRWDSGAKVLFSSANEEIIQQLGYIDSIFSLDLLEIEPEHSATRELRELMVHGKCPLPGENSQLVLKKTLSNGRTMLYTCRKLKHVPLAVAVVAKVDAMAISYDDKGNVTDLNQEYTNAMRVVLPPRRFCPNLDLSTLMPGERSLQHMFTSGNLAHCLPESAIQSAGVRPPPVQASAGASADDHVPLLARHASEFAALKLWRDTFASADDLLSQNATNCGLSSQLLGSFAQMVFLQMASGTSYVYPSLLGLKAAKRCWHLLMPDSLKFGFYRSTIMQSWEDSYLRDTSQFVVKEMVEYYDAGVGHSKERRSLYVAITRPVVVDKVFVAAAGAIVTTETIQQSWENYTHATEILFRQCHESGRTCFLLTSDVHVLAASNTYRFTQPRHLSAVDWHLFDYLWNISALSKHAVTNYEARCKHDSSRRGIMTGNRPQPQQQQQPQQKQQHNSARLGLPTPAGWLKNVGAATLSSLHMWLSYSTGLTSAGYQNVKSRKETEKLSGKRPRHRVSHTHQRSDCPYGQNVMERDTESCIVRTTVYTFVRHLPPVMRMVNDIDDRCIRTMTLYQLNATNIRVLSADPPCSRHVKPPADFAIRKRVAECDAMEMRTRKRPAGTIYSTFHPDEDWSDCISHGVPQPPAHSTIVHLAALLAAFCRCWLL